MISIQTGIILFYHNRLNNLCTIPKKLSDSSFVNELLENVKIASEKYSKIIGILYNGVEARVFINGKEDTSITKELQTKEFYIDLFEDFEIDTN